MGGIGIGGKVFVHQHPQHSHPCGIIHILVGQKSCEVILIVCRIAFLIVEICHREQEGHILGVFSLHHLELFQCFFLLACIEIKVTNDHLIAQVVRIFVGKVSHLLKGTRLIVHLQEETELLHGELFALPFFYFNLIEHLHHLGIVILFLIEFEQHHQHLPFLGKDARHLLHTLQRFIVAAIVEIERDEMILVPIVVGIKSACLLQSLDGKRVILRIAIKFRQLIKDSPRFRVELMAIVKQVDGSIVVIGKFLPHRLLKDIVELCLLCRDNGERTTKN